MKHFTKAMVGLDFSKMDEILTQKVANLSEVLGIEKLYFIHVAKDLSLPEEIREKYPDLVVPTDETLKAEINTLIKAQGFPKETEIEIIVEEGKPMETVLRWAKIKDVDVLIMGRKEELEGSGSLAKTMAHRAPCSVLFFTEKSPIKTPQKLLVPMDFSDHSVMTLEFADRLANEIGAEVLGMHVYTIPLGYYKTGKSHAEFDVIMKELAIKDYKKFLHKHGLPEYDCLFLLKEEGNEGRFIIKTAKENAADMILMGSRGRTASAAVLLGSIAEKLVNVNNEVPTLIFKKKGENMSFLDALMRI
ncbi:universal stress protein [Cecembia lonarensis]|uniref:Universal stress protein family protein n=1 Tax=Cecembia lonarensis (strain CCUG 58316 / KCTC 22772 / LW9) TaxID=1225176 RepID=K1M3I0_CECL9|nr:universal stress protein [Cecembia lonarensis]EKB50809.1 Universal stress protein family protein [Cecembia lonarensis LW9]